MRRLGTVLSVALLVSAGLAGCKDGGSATAAGPTGTPSASAVASSAPAGASPTPAASSKPATSAPAAAPALKCSQLKGALLGSTTLSYNGYHDSIPLGDGHFSGEDGAEVDLQPQCGVGDLTGDGAADLLGVVSLKTGGTGTFFTLVVWRNVKAQPVCQALYDLGDRTPVVSVTISGQKATVVWLTRTPDAPMAQVNLRRTSVFKLSGATLTELSHTDVPYSG
jgi:hypothetical protein